MSHQGQSVLEYTIAVLIGVLAVWLLVSFTDVGNHLDDDWPRLDKAVDRH
jgi:Flp pilus assembly pilin Flp